MKTIKNLGMKLGLAAMALAAVSVASAGERTQGGGAAASEELGVRADMRFSNGTIGTRQSPARVKFASAGVRLVDFGRDAFGWLEVRGAGAGDVRLGEKLDVNGRIDLKPGGTIRAAQVANVAFDAAWTRVPLVPDVRNTQGTNGVATGLCRDGAGSAHSSLHANVAALDFGLVPDGRVAKVADFIASKGMACSPYFAQYLLEALFKAGKRDAAIALLVSEGPRSWLGMRRQGATMTMEAWSLKAKPNQDWNHAWGAAPANLLPRFLPQENR